MYLEFFGLRALPFELTPNPKFVFMTPQHREAWSNLRYGLSARKSVTLLIGEVGTGKTTLLRTVLESDVCRNVSCVYISNPTLTRTEFVETLARGFGLTAPASTSKATMLAELRAGLEARNAAGQRVALIVDEAQALSDELLEEIRLLSNLETSEDKLLPLVLTGQPELAERLRQPHLRQLRQRVALRCEIGPFELTDTAAYIAHRLRVVGGIAASLFTREAVTLIHQRAKGIPRTINVLCDNALIGAFARGVSQVSAQVVLDVCGEFDLHDAAPVGDAALGFEPLAAPMAPEPSSDARLTVVGLPVTAGSRRTAAPAGAGAHPSIAPAAGEQTEAGTAREMFGQVAQRRRFSLFG